MKVDLYDANGTKKGDIELNTAIFGTKVNTDLLHRAVILRQANGRAPIAHTKTRSDVALVKSKAFRQKGTGRARRGARSTNILRGGGIAHGPRNIRNFTVSMPKKERRMALFSSLTSKAKSQDIFALESFEAETPKTKDFTQLIKKLPEAKNYLFVLSEKMPVLEKSAANIPSVNTILASYLNPYDILKADKICFLKNSFEALEHTFLSSSTS